MGDSQYDISAIQEEHDEDYSRREGADLDGDVGTIPTRFFIFVFSENVFGILI